MDVCRDISIFLWAGALTFHLLESPLWCEKALKENSMQFQIDNMTCSGCLRRVTKAKHSVDPRAEAAIDFPNKRERVVSVADESAVAAFLENVGFSPRLAA